MKTIKRKIVRVVKGTSPDDFETRLNGILETVEEPELKLYDGLLAYVIYTEKTRVPETAKERFECAGLTHYCRECEFYVDVGDRRRKWNDCSLYGEITRCDSRCCEYYYLNLERRASNEKASLKDITETDLP